MSMFKKQVKFTGKHADIMQKYCKDKGGNQDVKFDVYDNVSQQKNIYIFETRAHIYMVGAMLGIIYNRSAEPDNSTKTNSSIMPEMFEKQRKNLMRIYHYMVLSLENDLSADEKIKKAFSINKTEEDDDINQKKLENYVRGGLEIIDEIFSETIDYESVCNNIFTLLDTITEVE